MCSSFGYASACAPFFGLKKDGGEHQTDYLPPIRALSLAGSVLHFVTSLSHLVTSLELKCKFPSGAYASICDRLILNGSFEWHVNKPRDLTT